MTPKSREEIEKLKANWKSDPCWDLFHTEGFEEHALELKDYQDAMETIWAADRIIALQEAREQTGVVQEDVVSALYTFKQIEQQVQKQNRYVAQLDGDYQQVSAELAQAQIRATLLQAAQLKRIADALENMEDGDTLARSVSIWGSK